MATALQTETAELTGKIPATMMAVVYHGQNDVRLEEVPVPKIGPGELLVRVHTCGICGTDIHCYNNDVERWAVHRTLCGFHVGK